MVTVILNSNCLMVVVWFHKNLFTSEILSTISKFDWARFFIFVLVFVSHDFELCETSVVKSRPSVPHGANLFFF